MAATAPKRVVVRLYMSRFGGRAFGGGHRRVDVSAPGGRGNYPKKKRGPSQPSAEGEWASPSGVAKSSGFRLFVDSGAG